MSKVSKWVVLVVSLATLQLGVSVHAEEVIDDFESYKNNQIIGSSYNSSPWCRFGKATADNVIVTSSKSKVISGRMSAMYSVFWPEQFGSALYTFEKPKDLNKHKNIAFKMRSNDPDTQTAVRLAVSNGTTTFLSKESVRLSDKVQPLSFGLSQDQLVRVDGTDEYAGVIGKAACVGFQFQSKGGDHKYSETIIFDDLSFSDQDSE